jgi:DNA (cytosine-5)-methyltransferase 1
VKPRILDLFCCQGGASRGYVLAGFDVDGVDCAPQPRYPYPFRQADALSVLEDPAFIRRFYQAIHASPPCQCYSNAQRIQDREHPDLIGPIRERLQSLGLPFVLENVVGAPLREPVTLCGSMFGLRRTYRHRLFETGGFTAGAPEHSLHVAPIAKMGRAPKVGDVIHAVGNFSGVELVRRDWGVPWMNRDGIREAIPPAYTEYIGARLLRGIAARPRSR